MTDLSPLRPAGRLASLLLVLGGVLLASPAQAGPRKEARQAARAEARQGEAQPDPAIAPCTVPRCAVGISGNLLQRDGRPWVPRGVVITGLVAPRGYIKGVYAKAREAWGPVLLRQFQDIGVDTLRFNLSVAGLDPANPMGDRAMTPARKAEYLADIVAAVDLAERFGMNSLITLTTGKPSGVPDSETTPGPEAARAWAVLAPALAGRSSVFFNAFNEPGFGGAERIDEDASPWARWRSGYQPLVDAIRKSGARNVIVLDGISTSRVWRRNTDANLPHDPLRLLAFDIHPFPSDSGQKHKGGSRKIDYYRPADIDHWLDGWCDRHACIASAFFTGTGNNVAKGKCYDRRNVPDGENDSPRIAQGFVEHFTRKRIGVLAFAGDWNYRVFDRPGEPGAHLTSYRGFAGCTGDDKLIGPGELLRDTWLVLRRADSGR